MVVFWAILLASWAPGSSPAEPIQAEDVFLTLIADVEVSAIESGVLVEVAAKAGQVVQRGGLLARVDDSQAKLNERRASTELSRLQREAENDLNVQLARKQHASAEAELRRAEEANKRLPNSVSQTEFDRLRLEKEQAELRIEQARFDMEMAQFAVRGGEEELDLARLNIGRRQILAPLDGVVVEVMRRAGEWVDAGQPVARVVRLDRLRAEGLLPAGIATPRMLGQTVRVEVRFESGPVEQFEGRVVFVSPEVHPINGQVQVWAEVVNRDGLLRPGLKANMTIAAQ